MCKDLNFFSFFFLLVVYFLENKKKQKNMRSRPLNTCLICMCFLIYSSALPRAKDYRPKSSEYVSGPGNVANAASTQSIGTYSKEPSCEELRAMWRFSKRQSRAAEVTNEIPTYRDPFAFNVWEEYGARPRSAGRGFGRYRKPPVYGKVCNFLYIIYFLYLYQIYMFFTLFFVHSW